MFGLLSRIRSFFSNEIYSNVPASTWFPHKTGIVISRYAKIGSGCWIFNGVSITSSVFDDEGKRAHRSTPTIEDNVIILHNATVHGKITIGSGSIILSGAVVNSSFPPDSIIGGAPAVLLNKRTV